MKGGCIEFDTAVRAYSRPRLSFKGGLESYLQPLSSPFGRVLTVLVSIMHAAFTIIYYYINFNNKQHYTLQGVSSLRSLSPCTCVEVFE